MIYKDLKKCFVVKLTWPHLTTHAVFCPCLLSLPLSPFRNISLSLSMCSVYDSPVMISHKKRMMFLYHYHCLIDNKSLRTHKLFHLYLRYNKLNEFNWIGVLVKSICCLSLCLCLILSAYPPIVATIELQRKGSSTLNQNDTMSFLPISFPLLSFYRHV